jgi:hypothetical protein
LRRSDPEKERKEQKRADRGRVRRMKREKGRQDVVKWKEGRWVYLRTSNTRGGTGLSSERALEKQRGTERKERREKGSR